MLCLAYRSRNLGKYSNAGSCGLHSVLKIAQPGSQVCLFLFGLFSTLKNSGPQTLKLPREHWTAQGLQVWESWPQSPKLTKELEKCENLRFLKFQQS
jgi:hypothetical protein